MVKNFNDVYNDLSTYLEGLKESLRKHANEPRLHEALRLDVLHQIRGLERLLQSTKDSEALRYREAGK